MLPEVLALFERKAGQVQL